MKIPKYIKEKLKKMTKIMEDHQALETEVFDWIESKGIAEKLAKQNDLLTLTSILIYTEPYTFYSALIRELEAMEE